MKGKWLWLGSSNEKHFKTEFESEDRAFELCTKLSHFKTKLETVEDICQFLTITGIDNIVADLTSADTNVEQFKTKLNDLFQTLEELRLKGLKITIGPLLPWKKHSSETKRAAVDALKELKIKYPGLRQIARPPSLAFIKDQVHLTERAARAHYKSVFSASYELFFNKEDEYMTEDEGANTTEMEISERQEIEISAQKRKRIASQSEESDMGGSGTQPGKPTRHSIHTPEFQNVMARLEELKRQVNDRWTVDLLVSAGTKEDLDKIENNLNMNKVVIMGLDIPNLWEEEDWKVRIAQIKDAIADLFNFLNPGVEYKLGYVKHLNSKLKAARQIVEVTLETEKNGRSIRKAYADKVKQWREKKLFPDRMNGVSITPSLTLATRIRIAILKAVAKMLPEEFEDTEAWVIQHVARPVLKVEQKDTDGKRILTSYGFAQTMAYVLNEMPGYKFSDQDLFDAYAIAGTRFGNEIGHHFVILDMKTAMEMSKKKRQKTQKKL